MENKSNEANKSLTTLIPVLVMGLSVVMILNYFNKDKKETPPTNQPVSEAAKETNFADSSYNDFQFQKGPGHTVGVDGGAFYALLSSKGGRVSKLYLKSTDRLVFPESIIAEEKDPLATKEKAFEVTRGNGLDFQPHIYYLNERLSTLWQVDDPSLNSALFKQEGPFVDKASGITELRYTLPLHFKNHRLELIKIYRFINNEYFFHQITALRNMENKDFVLGGDLYYRPFGDIGPKILSDNSRIAATYSRFFRYNDSNEHSVTIPGSDTMGGCSLPGCGSKGSGDYQVYGEHPNTLNFLGSTSRYFLGYTRFLSASDTPLDQPDGVLLVNKYDPTGKEAFTSIFNAFRLAPASSEPVNFGSAGGDVGKDGHILPVEQSNFGKIRNMQRRNDMLVVDNQVYFGVRSDEYHRFNNKELAKAEFGSSDADSDVRSIIYSSGFMAIFSGIRDGIVWLMRELHKYIGNYGWVIIIIAVGFKLITWPLNQMQAKSMKRMTAIKPELEEINQKYKDNPQEKQKKTMELYKKHNVNPAKGCLPMLIQVPIFIALYSAFSESVELWRSPFIFWMTDLSQPDTIFVIKDLIFVKDFAINILPLFMVATQLVQQMTTNMTTDPQQKMIMYFMPLVMMFFFWSMPSGVTLYWTVQNLVTIIWQFAGAKLSSEKA